MPKSVEMSPAFAIHYDFNRGGRNAISPSQVVETSRRNSPSGALVVIRAVLNADSTYLVIRKFRLMVSYAARWILRSRIVLSPLRSHIGEVLSLGAYRKMSWVATGLVVASVQNQESLRDRSIHEFPSNTVCPVGVPQDGNASVPVGLPPRLPYPTIIRIAHIHKVPKPFGNWNVNEFSIGSVRTRHNIDVIRRGNLCHA